MAIRPEDEYPGQVTAADADYPQGGPKNDSLPGSNDGSPFEEKMLGDIWGLQQAILARRSITPTGNPETAQVSQYLAALLDTVLETTNNTPYTLGLAVFEKNFPLTQNPTFISYAISTDNDKLFIAAGNNFIYQFTLTTPGDIKSAVYDNLSFDASGQLTSFARAIRFSTGGGIMYLMDAAGVIYQYNLGVNLFSLQTVTYTTQSFNTTLGSSAWDFWLDPVNGDVLFVAENGGAPNVRVHQYTLADPFDIDTAVDDAIPFSDTNFHPLGIEVSPDNTMLYITSNNVSNIAIGQFELRTPKNLSDVYYTGLSIPLAVARNCPRFNSDGTRLYLGDLDDNDAVEQYLITSRHLTSVDLSSVGGEILERKRGTTANRPANLNSDDVGFQYFDTTLNTPIWWDGNNWVDAVGATA